MIPAPPFYGSLCIGQRFSDIITKTEYYFDWQRELTMTDEIFNFSIGNLSTTNMSNIEHSKYPALCRAGADHKAVSMRTFSRLTFIGAVLVAALVLFPGTALTQPDMPESLNATVGGELTWEDPNNGSITHYEYRLSTDNGITWDPDWTVIANSNATTTSFLPTGLTYGISYTIRLRAVDGNNTASEPAAKTFTPLLPAPSNLVAHRPHSGRVDLEWDTNFEVTQYRVDVDPGTESRVISAAAGPKTVATIRGLTNGTEYTFRVVAVDDSDDSLETSMPSSVNAEPREAPDGDGVTIWPERLTVPEGGSADYTVALNTQPTAEVKITVGRGGAGGDLDLEASTDELTFKSDNWDDDPQTVTVSAAEDDDGRAGITSFTHSVSSTEGNPYNGIGAGGVRAIESDNDPVGVTVWPQALRVPEGGSASYTVKLDTQPSEDVTIQVTSDQLSDEDLTAITEELIKDELIFTDRLIFMVSTWDEPQTVTVSAAEDADRLDGVATFSHSSASNDEDYYDLTIAPVTATEADKDRTRPRVTITSAAAAPVTGPFEVTIRFSENVYGFSLADIAVRNGTAAHFKKRSSRTYTVTITPAASGEVRVEVGANVARDRARNGNRPAVPFVIAAALEAAALQSRFESPAAGATVSGIDLIRGWTFAEAADVEIAEVVVYIDGQRETPIPCCSERPDVQAAYPAYPAANTTASGWGLTYNWGELAAGTHTLRVVATSSQGDTWESGVHTIRVLKPGDVVFADRFSLATAEVWLEDERLVLDGVMIRDKASQEAQEIEARYGWQTAAQGLRLVETTPLAAAPVESVRAGVARLLAGLAAWGRWLLNPGRVTAAAGLTAAYEAPADQAVVAGVGLIRGWAFADMGRELATVSLRIDEAASGPVPCCSRRPDVAAAYPDEGGALDSGWGLVFNYGNLAVGAHTIGVRITTEAGDVETTEHAVTVVQLGGYAFVDVFDVSGAEVWLEGEEIVLSGVEVRDKATQATQLVEVRLRWSSVTQGLTIVGSEPVP